MTLFDRSHLVFWELVPFKGTINWRNYVKNACQNGCLVVLLVQVYQKSQVNQEPEDGEKGGGEGAEEAEESGAGAKHEVEGGLDESQNHEGAVGVVDEGEENPEVLKQY
jgi:hypothetical protein